MLQCFSNASTAVVAAHHACQACCSAPRLSTDPSTALRLLLVARQHGVEACVAACVDLLLSKVRCDVLAPFHVSLHAASLRGIASMLSPLQANELTAPTCLDVLLAPLDTGVSAHAAVQSQGSTLRHQAAQQLGKLLRDDDGSLAADAGVQAALLAWLGPLHRMLNCPTRCHLFFCLPFELLRVSWHTAMQAPAAACLAPAHVASLPAGLRAG